MAGNGAFSERQAESFETERRDRLGFQKHEHIPGQAENTVLFVYVACTENDRLRKGPVGGLPHFIQRRMGMKGTAGFHFHRHHRLSFLEDEVQFPIFFLELK